MFRKIVSAGLVALPLVAGVSAPTIADSAEGEAVKVRGTIVDFGGKTLSVKTRDRRIVDLVPGEG